MNNYKISKGIIKGLVSALTVLGSMLAFTAFSDMTIWSLLEQYLKPLLGSITVGGMITIALNYLKIKSK